MALLLVILFGRGPGGLERRLATYRKAGIPTTPEELDQSYPKVPDEENEALKLGKASLSWKHLNRTNLLDFYYLDETIKRDPSVVTNAVVELVANRASLEVLHSISDPRRSRFSIAVGSALDDGHTLYAFQRVFREGLGVLRLECDVALLRGRPDEAARALASGLRILRMLGRAPSEGSYLDHVWILDGYLRELEVLLSSGSVSVESLELLQHELDFQEESLGASFAIQGLRVHILQSYREIWAEQFVFGGWVNWRARPLVESFLKLYKGSGIPARDLLQLLDAVDHFAQVAAKPVEVFQATEPRVISTAGDKGSFRLVLGHSEIVNRQNLLHDFWNRHLESVARVRCALTAVAVERWRRVHEGEIPDRLDRLVPTHLRAVPVQPSGAQALGYSANPSGYSIKASYGDSTRSAVQFVGQASPRQTYPRSRP